MKNSYIILFCLIITSCSTSFFYEKNIDFESNIWALDKNVEFVVDISDSLKKYDFYFDLRHLQDYPYQNFWIFLNTIDPIGKTFKDTIQFKLADQRGKWLGKTASGNIISHHILMMKGKNMNIGQYKFVFSNALREQDNSNYFQSVGISVVEH